MKILLALVLVANAAQFTNDDRRFKFEYDEPRWEVVPEKPADKQKGDAVDRAMAQKTLVTVQRKVADDKYHARFSVVTDSLDKFKGTPEEKAKAYRAHAIDFLKSQRFHILSTEDKKLPGITEPVVEIVANQRDFGLTFKQVIFLKGNEAYMLTAATRTAKYDEYQKEVSRFFDTFTFLPAK